MAGRIVELLLRLKTELDPKSAQAALKSIKAQVASAGKSGSPIDAGKINADARAALKGVTGLRDEFGRFQKSGVEAARKVSEEMRKVGQEGQAAAKGIGGGGLGGLLKGGAVAGTIAGIGAIGGAMIKGNSELENYMTQFEVLTGSVQNAGKLFGDIKKLGLQTPFETGDLANATQTMLGFGISQRDIIPNLKMLGDISGGNAEKLKSLSLSFSQVQSAGKLTGGDLLQMINAGFNPLKVISEKTGKSIGELRAEMEKGGISADMVSDAMKTATSEGGQFFGMMQKQSGTMSGMSATLKDVVQETLNTLGGSVFAEAKKAMSGMLTLLQSPEITGAVQKLGTSLGPLVSALAGGLQSLLPVILQVFGVFANSIGPIAQSLGSIITPLSGVLASTLKSLSPVFEVIVQAVTRVLGIVGQVMGQLQGPLQQILGVVANLLGVVLAPVLEIVGNLFAALAPVLVPIIQLVAELLTAIMPLIELALYPIIKVLEALASLITAGVNLAVDSLGKYVANLTKQLRDAVEWIKGAAQTVSDFFSSLMGGMDETERRAAEASAARAKQMQAQQRQTLQTGAQAAIQMAEEIQRAADAAAAEAEEKKKKAAAPAPAKKPKTPKVAASDTEFQKTQKAIADATKLAQLEERRAQASRDSARIAAGRAKDTTDELLTERGKLALLEKQRNLLREKFLGADGKIKIKLDSKKGETEAAVMQLIDDAAIEIQEQQNRINEMRVKLIPEVDVDAVEGLLEERLKIDVEMGLRGKDEIADFIEKDIERLRSTLAKTNADRITELDRAKKEGVLSEKEYADQVAAIREGRDQQVIEAENRIANRVKELRDLRFEREMQQLEERQQREDAILKKSAENQAKFIDNLFRLLEKGGSAAIDARKNAELADLERIRKQMGKTPTISEEGFKEREAEIERKAAREKLILDEQLRGQRLEGERQASLQELSIRERTLKESLELARKHGKTDEAARIEKELTDVATALEEKGSIMAAVGEDVQTAMTDIFSNLFKGDMEAVKEPFRKVFAVLGGALTRLASAKVTEVLLSAIGPTGIGGLIAAVGAKPAIESIINAILGPLLSTILSFSSGGRVDSPTLAWIGDASNARPGSDSEWITRDDQLREIMATVVAASQFPMLDAMQEQLNVLTVIAAKEYDLKGDKLSMVAKRADRKKQRRVRGRRGRTRV